MVLLEEVDEAISVFSDLINAVEERPETSEDETLNAHCERVPYALAGLAAAANDLRARINCDEIADEQETGGTAPIRHKKMLHPGSDQSQKPNRPSPLGFTIFLREDDEDDDDASESEV